MLRSLLFRVLFAALVVALRSGTVWGSDAPRSQSFEGYLREENGKTLFVWLDLKIPAQDGQVAGTYFYKQGRGELNLLGTRLGKTMSLTETNKRQQITGTFTLTVEDDVLRGDWQDSSRTRTFKATLYKTKPAYRKHARFDPEEFFREEKAEMTSAEFPFHRDAEENVVSFAQCGLVSFSYHISGEVRGGYSLREDFSYTIDLATRKVIDLWEELEPSRIQRFEQYLCEKARPQFAEWRRGQKDSELAAAFSKRDNPDLQQGSRARDERSIRKKLKSYLQISAPGTSASLGECLDDARGSRCWENSPRAVYHLEPEHLVYHADWLFNLPHGQDDEQADEASQGKTSAVNDFSYEVEIPFDELKSFLRQDSVLQNLPGTAKPLPARKQP